MFRLLHEFVVKNILVRIIHNNESNIAIPENSTPSMPDVYSRYNFVQVLDEFEDDAVQVKSAPIIILISLYIPIFLLAMLGNLSVFTIILMNPALRTMTNLLLVNLTMADLAGKYQHGKTDIHFR
ncbi:hypothetical protein SNE40_011832 [Patella caerulea]|uniref:G-protein coupled receptors family 1 profile domain-containing protein n=1 Tax=Patella caerulea TaxID=87958 RepID=A0AAN8JNJ7_PATCE